MPGTVLGAGETRKNWTWSLTAVNSDCFFYIIPMCVSVARTGLDIQVNAEMFHTGTAMDNMLISTPRALHV